MFSEVRSDNCVIEVANKVHIGKGVVLGENCKHIKIGYGSFIGRDTYIDVEYLEIGEYTTIHHGSILHGIKTTIGHNCWIGHYTIIDSLGGNTRIGNNVGVGAHSQLWSHMKFGDVLAGCRWNSSSELSLGDDVWLVGHSIIGPITAEPRSMLLTGSVMTKKMRENTIYAGSPAKEILQLGGQFKEQPLVERQRIFDELKFQYKSEKNRAVEHFIAVDKFDEYKMEQGLTQFDLSARRYLPLYSDDEYDFIKYMLYDKAKFVPVASQNAKTNMLLPAELGNSHV